MNYTTGQIELAQTLLATPRVTLLEIILKLQAEVEALKTELYHSSIAATAEAREVDRIINEELKALRMDAGRYRWLRGDWFEIGMHNINTAIGAAHHRISKVGDVETLDAAIDAAIAGEVP
jgi:hypothetical protein